MYKLIVKTKNLKDMVKVSLFSPFYNKLLPDLPPESAGAGEKTLVINLNKTLISYTYEMGTGFKIIKRKGLERFLLEMSNYYEIVIFGTEDSGVSIFL